MTTLLRLKYLSRQVRVMTRTEIDEIVAAARERNAERDITGALVATGNIFFQIIEGPSDAVVKLFAKIRADARHTDVVLLADQPDCKGRLFPTWRMERVALEGTQGSMVIERKLRELAKSVGPVREGLTRELSRMVASEAAASRAA